MGPVGGSYDMPPVKTEAYPSITGSGPWSSPSSLSPLSRSAGGYPPQTYLPGYTVLHHGTQHYPYMGQPPIDSGAVSSSAFGSNGESSAYVSASPIPNMYTTQHPGHPGYSLPEGYSRTSSSMAYSRSNGVLVSQHPLGMPNHSPNGNLSSSDESGRSSQEIMEGRMKKEAV